MFEYEFDLEKLRFAKLVNPNIHIIVETYIPADLELLQKFNIDFYLSSIYAARNFRELDYLVSLGVTDVYIVDDLCYQLDKVKKFCQQHNVNSRLILNEIPSQRPDANSDPCAPYFIPEVIDELIKYIDVFEFNEEDSWARLRSLYKIWFEQKQWRADLKYLYSQLELDIPNQTLIPNFIKYRMTCGYKCSYGSVCKKCSQFLDIAHTLFEKKVEYIPPKEEEKGEDNV